MTLALALLASAPALADSNKIIDAMTQNQYLGADLNPIIAAGDPAAFNAALLQALSDIADNDFPARAGALAELIADRLPDLVGLQEVFLFGCIPLAPPMPGMGCDDPAIAGAFQDHLSLTLQALDDLGETYEDVATVNNLDITLPVDTAFNGFFDIAVTVLDRDVILAGEDVKNVSPVDYSEYCPERESVDGCNYLVVAEADTALGLIRQERGWVGVDATIGNKKYRFVNTHLEVQVPDQTNPLSPFIQAAQAGELIGVLAATTSPSRSLIVVGDINSSSEDPILLPPPGEEFPLPPPFNQGIIPPYTQFIGSDQFPGAGYTDAWDFVEPADEPGFSCCQDADLRNPQSILDERIDVIFSIKVPKNVEETRVLGAKRKDKTPPPGPGLWPSDHGSVAAELEFK
jgi:hypothetical protein